MTLAAICLHRVHPVTTLAASSAATNDHFNVTPLEPVLWSGLNGYIIDIRFRARHALFY